MPVTPESLAGEGGATSHAVEPLADDCTLSSSDFPHAVWNKRTGMPPEGEVAEPKAEVDELKGEVDYLKAEVDELKGEVRLEELE